MVFLIFEKKINNELVCKKATCEERVAFFGGGRQKR